MGIDYPAAHSMDTEWFAVDKDGHIAILESMESGAVPAAFLQELDQGCHGEELLEQISKVTAAVLVFEKDQAQADSVGVFRYECNDGYGSENEDTFDEEALPPYERIMVPTKPITVADLPEELASKINLIKFDCISFSESQLLQPIEFLKCELWGDYPRIYDSSGGVQPLSKDRVSMGFDPKVSPPSPSKTENKPWWQKLFGG